MRRILILSGVGLGVLGLVAALTGPMIFDDYIKRLMLLEAGKATWAVSGMCVAAFGLGVTTASLLLRIRAAE